MHIVPLAKQAVRILSELQPLTGSSAWVFPGVRTNGEPMSEDGQCGVKAAWLCALDDHRARLSRHGIDAIARMRVAIERHRATALARGAQCGEGGLQPCRTSACAAQDDAGLGRSSGCAAQGWQGHLITDEDSVIGDFLGPTIDTSGEVPVAAPAIESLTLETPRLSVLRALASVSLAHLRSCCRRDGLRRCAQWTVNSPRRDPQRPDRSASQRASPGHQESFAIGGSTEGNCHAPRRGG